MRVLSKLCLTNALNVINEDSGLGISFLTFQFFLARLSNCYLFSQNFVICLGEISPVYSPYSSPETTLTIRTLNDYEEQLQMLK